jgi:hypothetical protein
MTFEVQRQMKDELHMETQDKIAEAEYIEGQTDAGFGVELDLTKNLHPEYIRGFLDSIKEVLSNPKSLTSSKSKLILKWELVKESKSTTEEF